ncbi:carboxylesterase/lipase family protein [Williamsia sp.]|uniref:carboxylesterase/lipase family protein n=1 Tax=Williamsia sp. TaxID=1872085 RepID=UPI001A1BE8C2|nr:carboxylesterase/lipase family protein [Williamsia sp.]MBJ7287287.1 carboxylesterase/lipase family protein [Williamsia sp.]
MTSDRTVVETSNGPVRGTDDGRTRVWKGIRYAAPPIGELRWRAPVPPESWTDVADATRFGPVAPQPDIPVIDLGPDVTKDEDCLTLNVSVASSTGADDPKPVMVWIHGGAYILGSTTQPLYDAAAMVERGDVVIVTVNYRLGAFGFLDLSAFGTDEHPFDSNLALRDVILALQWVRYNIAAFGGDPEQVTVFGESAGGGMVTTLMTVPSAAGLFHRAIAQSSPATSVYDGARARRIAEMFLDDIGIAPADIGHLRDVPTDAVAKATFRLFDDIPTSAPGTLAFAPVVDRDLVPDYPLEVFRAGNAHPVPLLIGTNKDEAALFKLMKSPLIPITPDAIRAMFAQIAVERPELAIPHEADILAAYAGVRRKGKGMAVARDIGFRMPTVWLAEGHSAIAPVFLYRFDWATPLFRLLRVGATHATELPYVFGNLVSGRKDITFKLGGLTEGKAVSARMQRRWLNFAVSGDPNGVPNAPIWRPYDSGDRASLVIDRNDRAVRDLDHDLRLAWGDDVLSFP